MANTLSQSRFKAGAKPTVGREMLDLSRPTLFDANGKEIDFLAVSESQGGGVVVSRANSGFLSGGTGYAQHGASFRKRALASWLPWAGSPDTDIVRNLPILRARSRDLFMSFPIARAAIETKVTNVVGTGIRPMPMPDGEVLGLSPEDTIELSKLILREWRYHMETELCDFDRQHDVYTKQAEVYRTKEMAGDAPLLFVYRDDGKFPYSLRLRTLDPDRIMNPYTIPVPTTTQNVWGGIELNGYNGPLQAMWVAQFHPMDFGLLPQSGIQKWERIKIFTDEYLTRNAVLHMNIERPQQRRGVPPLAVVLEMAKGMLRFTHEKIQKEVLSNMFSVFITSPMPTEETFKSWGFSDEDIKQFYKVFPYDISMAAGGYTFMKPGDQVTFANPQLGATDYKIYQETNGIIFCAAVQTPFEIVMKHFGASYSASKAAFSEFFKTVKMERQNHINQVDQPIYENFLGELVLQKVIRFPKYFKDYRIRKALSRSLWTGIAQGMIEPLKEIQAAILRMKAKVSTLQKESSEMNDSNWEENVVQAALEMNLQESSGLTYLAFNNAGTDDPPPAPEGDGSGDGGDGGSNAKTD